MQLNKGNYLTLSVVLTDYDGNPDLTTLVTINVSPGVLTTAPATVDPSNRTFYVSVPTSATVGTTGIWVDLSAQIPGSGSGAGVPPIFKSVRYIVDSVVPIDHRAASPVSMGPEQPLPHP